MVKNKNNNPVWSERIKKNKNSIYKKVGSSLNVDKRLVLEQLMLSFPTISNET